MTSLYLHIGTEKTGSTAIQNLLTRLVSDADKPCFLSPINHVRVKLREGNFTGLYHWIRGLPQPESASVSQLQLHRRIHRFLSRLVEESREHGHLPVFLSNEHISKLEKEEVDELIDRLGAYFDRIHVVCFLRSHVSFSLSMLSQALKAGVAVDLEKPFNTFYSRSRAIRTFKAWGSASVSSIYFSEFNPPGSSGNSLIHQFIDPAVDLNLLPESSKHIFVSMYESMPRLNLSLPTDFFAISASFNQYLSTCRMSPRELRKTRSKGLQYLANADSSRGGGLFTADALQRWIAKADHWEVCHQEELGSLDFSEGFYQSRDQLQRLHSRYSRQSVALSSAEKSLLSELFQYLELA